MTCKDCKHFGHCTHKGDYLHYYKTVCSYFTNKNSCDIPCKIGDTVYAIRNYHNTKIIRSGKVREMYFVGEEMKLCIVVYNVSRGTWGKDIFGTYEEARKVLEGDK